MKPRPVALVSGERRMRAEIARYLEQAGFAVRVFERPPRPPVAAASLLWLTERGVDTTSIATALRTWLSASAPHHAVVVTWRPTVLDASVREHGERLHLFAPPVFAWQLVDALRSA